MKNHLAIGCKKCLLCGGKHSPRGFVSVCKTQCFFTANITAMVIQDKNERPRKSMHLKMLKPEIKSSELMHPVPKTVTVIPVGIESRNSRLLSLAFENRDGRYEVPDGTTTACDCCCCCHSFLWIFDFCNVLSRLSATFFGYELMLQSNIIGCIKRLWLPIRYKCSTRVCDRHQG